MTPRIAFCTTCKGRAQHLKLTLPKNLLDNQNYDNCVFIVLDYSSPDDLIEYLEENHAKDIDSGKLVVYRYAFADTFHMAHAKNMAHRCGMLEGADILVNLDADGFTGPGFAEWIAEVFSADKQIFLQAMQNRWVKKGGQAHWLCESPEGNYEVPVPKGCNGRIACTTSAFLKAGGYDEKYDTWGPDDKDFNVRLRRLGYSPILIPREFLGVVPHNNKMRFKDYPHVAADHGCCFQVTVHDSPESVANFGNFGCGSLLRGFFRHDGHQLMDYREVELWPLPTRIFGIGMHKTATTSLHLALQQLGFDSAHWENAHWAKAVWREMNNMGKSPTLEKHYALCDLPIPMLMRKLDAAYPGSKFIFTVTSEEAWIKATELHWDPNHNPNRARWDIDPFTNRIHQQLYGRTDFDRETFLARYRHHNLDVLAYFRDRPNDLLVMDMSKGAGWKELCEFFVKPVPPTPYPHGNSDIDLANRNWLHSGDL